MPEIDQAAFDKMLRAATTQPKDPGVRKVWIIMAVVALIWLFGGPRYWMMAESAYYDAARGSLPGSTITHRPDGTIVVVVKDVP